ncbi:hypothetical protein TVAG_248960 [Trichomonas vaginalis G3]|uniref:DUF3447 domain-containing protein n=1 Tax=Trichomonas vaginalis (strain ATCC PRA-98 / G3) TaxID=412133 RepID=A2DCA0_TRIV3|nr:protein of unknown function (DUF3447) [Trichomonas vaginalis G3]EAY21837.1 hypothetical protein TVAG_248960 [Trichomonas vaginalis G3]KAI5487693.1 protein of unknown function (DUF3447) [Trichomonas vaginalis G3]|eukprot:XP_001582823.1 hypothetical protein [Trichomonas vaginalis G3]
MSNQDFHDDTYVELRSIYKYHIDSYITLYQLKTEKEEELREIYKMIKTELIDSKKYRPEYIVKEILCIIPFNNRYSNSYLKLAKFIFDDYHVIRVTDLQTIPNYLFYKEYGIKLDRTRGFGEIELEDFDIHSGNTIYRTIMYNNKEKFIVFTESEEFDEDQKLVSSLYPYSKKGYSLLELCCYHGAVDCFKLLRTKFDSEITKKCLRLSFLGRNPEIMSECLKHQNPDKKCMIYAIISHNIDFVTFLMNEYNIEIDIKSFLIYNNLDSFLVYFDQTTDINQCFVYSTMFNISSIWENFLSHGANINAKDKYGETALHYAALNNN